MPGNSFEKFIIEIRTNDHNHKKQRVMFKQMLNVIKLCGMNSRK